jgi:Xaa-Pro dipeptidase
VASAPAGTAATAATAGTAAPGADHGHEAAGRSYPTFSLAERDRRWGRVRELMRDHDVACIVASACTGVQGRSHADVKYLTQLGNNDEQFGVVFPVEGTPVVTGWPDRRPGDDWIEERRLLEGGFLAPAAWGRTLAAILREMGMGDATVAVCGLGPGGPGMFSAIRQSDGYVPYTTMKALEEGVPGARFVDATPILGRARYVKGEEEIEFIRVGTTIAERALFAMAAASHSGAFEPRIYASMLTAELEAGGTLPTMISWTSGPISSQKPRLEQPVHRRLCSGDLVSVEIEGRWAGYNGQVDATMTVGDVPAWAADAHAVAAASAQATIEAIKPGVTFGAMRRVAREVATSPDVEIRLIMGGRGLGDDGPLVGADGPMDDLEIEESTSFVVKPAVMVRGIYCARVGETIVVRPDGAHRLGTRPLDHYWHVD